MIPTTAQRRQLDAHSEAELTYDLDAVMATVDVDPAYEWQPAGVELRGRDAVRAMYETFLPRWKDLTETRSLRIEVRSEWWSDVGRIREHIGYIRTESGAIERMDFVVVVLFGEGGVKGERTYASDAVHRLNLGPFFDLLQPIMQ
jgi:hypothetical protein